MYGVTVQCLKFTTKYVLCRVTSLYCIYKYVDHSKGQTIQMKYY